MRKRIALASIAIVLPAIAADESKPLLWGGSPYTLEWLQENHGKYDNRWTAVYEQWLQGDWILEVGPDGTERLRAADVRMSNPSFNTSQNEFQIVINPTDPTNAVGTSNDSLASGVGVYTTTDSGATWTAFDAPFGIGACCDPGVAFAANGDVYVTTLAAPPVYIIRSTDKGATWGPRHTVPGISDRENVTVDNGATSPFNGRVYVTYSFGGNGSQIAGYSSTDQGTTWQATGVIGGPSPPAGYQQSSDPYVASDGTLYVGYQEYENQSAGCVAPVRNWLSKSTDGGATFTQSLITGAPIVQGGICLASQAGRGVFCINGGGQYFRSRSHPILSGSPTDPSKVYVIYSGGDLESAYSCAGGSGFHSDIIFVKSTDGGATWSAKQKINTDPQGHDQYYGWIDTAPNGHIWVGWHDRRSDPNNFQHIWYQADSTDEGATWNEVATADVASQPSTFIGDYAGMAAANTLALGMWWDSRIKSGGDPYTEPIPVSGCAVVVSPGTLPGGTVGVPYSQTVTASGGTAPYSFTITGTLPPGLSTTYLAPDRLQISGTPTTPGGYLFTVTATDSASCAGGTTYQVAITCGTITLAPATLPNGSIGFPYSQTITASGGTAPYTFAVTVGSLPPGLSLAAGGILSGTPTTLGSYPFTVTATDANSCTGSQAYTIVVTNCPPITLSPATLPPAYSGVPYSVTITASGGTAPYGWSITAGSIPPGMSMTPGPTTLVISGTPTVVGSFCFTVTATDVNACSGSQAYCIDVITLLVDYLVGEPLDINSGNRVRVFDNAGAPTATDFLAYAAGKWGTNVSSGDVDGLQFEEIQTGPGPGDVYGPQVRGWQRTGTAMGKINFYAYGTLKYGVNVGSANVDGDAYDEILSGAGPGAAFGPHVRGWNFDATTLTAIAKISYFAYGTLKYGVNVSGGSIDADSYSELLTAPGPGVIFGPQVRGWNYDAANVTAISKVNFNAFTTLQYGANVDGGDFDGDGYAEIDVSPGPGPTASFPTQFRGFNYDAATVSQLAGFDVTPWTTFYGGRVGAGDIGRDGADDLVCAPGPDPSAGPTVRAYTYTGSALTVIPPGVTAFPAGTGANATGANLGF